MKMSLAVCMVLTVALGVIVTVKALPNRQGGKPRRSGITPIKLIGVIHVPGNPLMSSDVAWVDPGTKRFYLAERSNFGIDVIDAENDLFVGRIPGFAGAATQTPPPPNGVGPNGVLVTPNKKLWAGDGNSMLRVADVNPESLDYLKVIQSVSTAIPYCGSHCNRIDEIGYDPEDRVILAVNHDDQTAGDATAPPARGNPYISFVSADTYKVLGTITFEGAGGLEQPLWDPGLHRFFLSVEGYRNGGGINPGFGEIAVINPKTMKAEKSYNPGKCRPGGEVMGPGQHLIVLCGGPIILNAQTGRLIATTTPAVGGGDEVWYNPGDERFYFTGLDKSAALPVTSVVVVDGETGRLLQEAPDPGARQAVTFAGNNHIFTPVQVTPAVVADPSADKTTCSLYGYRGKGCIAVFAHVEP